MFASSCPSMKKRRYELHDILGVGGFSTVYRATDKHAGRDVAIKVSTRSKDNPAEHEAQIGRDLEHPHIIRLLDSFKTRKHYYLVYELLEGKELFDHIVRSLLSLSERSPN
jgi:serine/threonine-protein kinase